MLPVRTPDRIGAAESAEHGFDRVKERAFVASGQRLAFNRIVSGLQRTVLNQPERPGTGRNLDPGAAQRDNSPARVSGIATLSATVLDASRLKC